VQQATQSGGRCVVIIDDSVDSADALAMLLELEGHVVHKAHDGMSGLALIRSVQAEIVLCDIGLPGLSGYQVAEAVRRFEKVPVLVAISGHTQAEENGLAAGAAFDHYLVKPVDPRALLALVENAGGVA